MIQKDVVDLKKELGIGGEPTPSQPKAKVYRFKKLQFPLQIVKLKSGRTVQFQVRKLNTGGYSKWGLFETEDPGLAKELQEIAGKSQYVISL